MAQDQPELQPVQNYGAWSSGQPVGPPAGEILTVLPSVIVNHIAGSQDDCNY